MSQASPLTPARQRAHALASSGDLAGARALLEQAVELGKVNLAEDDPDVLRTAYELGAILQQVDDPMAARRVLEEAYAAGQWRLGDSDPLMVQISHDIGVVAEELGNRHEARKAFARVAELGPAALGDGHPAVARARAYLGPDQTPSPVRVESAPQQPTAPGERTQRTDNDTPTTVFDAVPPAPQQPPRPHPHEQPAPQYQQPAAPTFQPQAQQRPGTVQPPSPANQHVWTGPPKPPAPNPVPAPRSSPVDEPTIVQPMIGQRPAPHYQSGPPIPQQRSAPFYPEAPISGQAGGPGAYDARGGLGGLFGDGGGSGPYGERSEPAPHQPQGRRGLGIFAAIAAVMAAVIAVAALVFVLANRTSDPGDSQDVPTLAGPAPTDVQLVDNGSAVKISWTDPTDAKVSFMVIMGRPGLELKPAGTLGPGKTSFEMSGLNEDLNYCFAVVAVYSGNKFSTSSQACTSRASATPR
ncbi:tetratricopeptide repeat protein [Actinoplanes bogorensis]|uniref:Tetratricopeptide repeat protein n=1 Tax=Paractinoplanes bogorensis TaxID=1610840 RepID=A0ABS5YUE6_9ACTN|nr:tetratricopeptide repeat protein [Actinoplanes bogorensis]MBU2667078.1 tetratricopeptide repeat protein [Actinoplanes bogorensis]